MIKSERFPIKIVVTYLLIFTIFLSSCTLYFMEDRPYREATKKELEIFYSAVDTNNVTLCYKLDPRAEKRRVYFFDYETEEFELMNHCFFKIAIQTKNPKLCDEMLYIGDDKISEYVDDRGLLIYTTLKVFESYKESCIKKASR